MATYRLGDDGVLTVVDDEPDGGVRRGGPSARQGTATGMPRLRRWSRRAVAASAVAALALAGLALLGVGQPEEGGQAGPVACQALEGLGEPASHGAQVVSAAARRLAANLASSAGAVVSGEG